MERIKENALTLVINKLEVVSPVSKFNFYSKCSDRETQYLLRLFSGKHDILRLFDWNGAYKAHLQHKSFHQLENYNLPLVNRFTRQLAITAPAAAIIIQQSGAGKAQIQPKSLH